MTTEVRHARTTGMKDHVYKILELVGSSEKSIEDAIQNALTRASKTIRDMKWFEVVQTRGHIEKGAVGHYQVTCALDLHWRDNSRRGPMTGSGVTRLFIVGERRTTRSSSSGAHSRDPLAHPPFALKLSFDRRLVDDRPYFDNLCAAKFIDHILGKRNSLFRLHEGQGTFPLAAVEA